VLYTIIIEISTLYNCLVVIDLISERSVLRLRPLNNECHSSPVSLTVAPFAIIFFNVSTYSLFYMFSCVQTTFKLEGGKLVQYQEGDVPTTLARELVDESTMLIVSRPKQLVIVMRIFQGEEEEFNNVFCEIITTWV